MSLIHLHLVMNHFPVFALPLGLAILLFAMKGKSQDLFRFGYGFLVVVAVLTVPIFLTGEPAEDALKALVPGLGPLVHKHEEAAEVALILVSLTGALAVIGLLSRGPLMKWERPACYSVLVVGALGLASIAYTSNLGGQIRHTEIRETAASQAAAEMSGKVGGVRDHSQHGHGDHDGHEGHHH